MLERCWEEAASPLLCMVRRLCGMGRANPARAVNDCSDYLFSGYLPEQLPLFCGFIGVGEVSSSVGSCWFALRVRQGTAWPAPLLGATVVALATQGTVRTVLG